jgi:hypothetical protein
LFLRTRTTNGKASIAYLFLSLSAFLGFFLFPLDAHAGTITSLTPPPTSP